MIGAWNINVSGRVYGPFTSERMRSFVGEGRLAPHSLVARDGSSDWHEARDEPEFTEVFTQRNPPAPLVAPVAPAAPAPAPQSPLSSLITRSPQPQPQPTPTHALQAHGSPPNLSAVSEHDIAHFAVVIDQKAQGGSANIESAIGSLGLFYRLTYNVWIISTDQSVSAVRNRLVQELGKSDSLFVIDASRGKAAWFNFGPEADVRIRRVWQKTG